MNPQQQYISQQAQSLDYWGRGAYQLALGAAGVAPDWDRDISYRQHWIGSSSAPAPAPAGSRPRPQPYEVMVVPRTSTPPLYKDITAPEAIVAHQVDCDDWDQSQIFNWRKLLKDVQFMKKPDEKVTAINTLIDSFHRLNLGKDQEDLIDLIYDYCEPDVSLEVRDKM